jgi:serine protease Do
MFQALKLNRPYGVLVNGVHTGSPAEQADIKVGDVILAVNGREVDDPEALRFRIATLSVGTSAQLTVSRNGQEKNITVTLKSPPDSPARDISDIGGHNPFTGATVANINPALSEEMGLEHIEAGVTIIKVKRGTIANHLQFQPGDVIAKLNNRAVASVADLKSSLEGPVKSWAITIKRGGQTFTLTVGD